MQQPHSENRAIPASSGSSLRIDGFVHRPSGEGWSTRGQSQRSLAPAALVMRGAWHGGVTERSPVPARWPKRGRRPETAWRGAGARRVAGKWLVGNVQVMKRFLIATVAASLSALAVAGPAQADDQSYLDAFNSYGFVAPWFTDSEKLYAGHRVCELIHSGMTPEDIVRRFHNPPLNYSPPQAIDAAQHELCPDTLPAGQ